MQDFTARKQKPRFASVCLVVRTFDVTCGSKLGERRTTREKCSLHSRFRSCSHECSLPFRPSAYCCRMRVKKRYAGWRTGAGRVWCPKSPTTMQSVEKTLGFDLLFSASCPGRGCKAGRECRGALGIRWDRWDVLLQSCSQLHSACAMHLPHRTLHESVARPL